MKRALCIGILSAATLAGCVGAQAQSNVYSLNVVSVLYLGHHMGGLSVSSVWGFDCAAGRFGIDELSYWTDTTGQVVKWNPTRGDKPGDTQHKHTQVLLGPVSFSVPISPRSTTAAGVAGAAVALLVIFTLFLRGRRQGALCVAVKN